MKFGVLLLVVPASLRLNDRLVRERARLASANAKNELAARALAQVMRPLRLPVYRGPRPGVPGRGELLP